MPWPGIGGTEHATLRIAAAVREHGYRSIAFCRDDAPEVHDFFRRADIETVPYSLAEISIKRPLAFLRNSIALARELTRRGVDLVHCADIDAGMQIALAARMARRPVLCHVRNPWTAAMRRERLLLASVHTFVFVSKDTWRQFALEVSPARGRVLYDGILADDRTELDVRAAVRDELSLHPDERVVGMTARVAPQKDYFTLAKAAVLVLEAVPNARFVIVGDHDGSAAHREHYALVRAELTRLGVMEAFHFTGFRSDVPRVMRAFDVFVLSTHFEGLPLVVLEAMGMGLPVVATAVNGIPEVIEGEEVGLLVPHEDAPALARQLIALLTDEARARRIGAAGRELVGTRFSVEAFEHAVVDLYAHALVAETQSSRT